MVTMTASSLVFFFGKTKKMNVSDDHEHCPKVALKVPESHALVQLNAAVGSGDHHENDMVDADHTVYALVLVHLIAGAAYTLAISWQNGMTVNNASFSHPYIQCFFVLLGQGLNLPISMLMGKCRRSSGEPPAAVSQSPIRYMSREDHRRTQIKIFCVLFVTSITETIETALGVVALTMMDASVFSMLRITQLLFAALLQKLVIPCIKNLRHRRTVVPEGTTMPFDSETKHAKYSIAEYFGLALIFVGVFLVFASKQTWFPGVTATTQGSQSSNNVIGVVLLLASMAILAAEAAVYEYILNEYPDEIDSLQLIGYQGAWCTIHTIFLVLFVYMVLDVSSESPRLFLEQLRDGGWMPTTAVVLSCVGVTATDATGTVLTKLLSANTRPALQPVRTAIIWLFSLATNLVQFNPLQLAGFVISTFGSLMFKKMIHLPRACA